MDVKPGYKQTEVGVIPEDWKTIHLQDIGQWKGGATPSMKNRAFWKGGTIPWASSGDIKSSQLVETELKITDAAVKQTSTTLLPKDSIIIVTRSGILRRYLPVAKNKVPMAINQDIKAIIPNSMFISEYILQILLGDRFKILATCLKTGTTVESVDYSWLRAFQIPISPIMKEQFAIAAALSDVDALIAALDRLIAKKRDIKQAAMQELLTGKRRLPGFCGEWKTRLLGEVIIDCTSGATPYRGHPDYYRGIVKWITSGELNYNRIFDTIEHISEEAVQKTNLRVHPIGTFLMAITGLEAAGTRGACGIVGNPATTNQSCMAIYPTSELKTEYLYYYYVFRGNALALRFCQGTKQQSYTAKLVRLLPIDLPPTVEEQTAISAILSDMDAEIAALEARREKTLALKQGMMQELLTGRIRLA